MSKVGMQQPIERTSERLKRKFSEPVKLKYPKTEKNSLKNLSPETRYVAPYPISGDGKICTTGKAFSRFA